MSVSQSLAKRHVDVAIGTILRLGAFLGAGGIAIGEVLYFAGGAHSSAAYPHTFNAVVAGLSQGSPLAVTTFGLLILLATPIIQVGVSLIAFLIERDRLYVGITALVLVVLTISIFWVGSAFARPEVMLTHDATTIFFFLMLGVSAVAGFIGALAGVGGGLLIVPILTLVFHVPFEMAVGASIISVIATSTGSAAAYVKEHIVNRRIGTFLEVATTLGAVGGALLTAVVLHTEALFVIFGFVLIAAVVPLVIRSSERKASLRKSSVIARRLRLASTYPDPSSGVARAYHVVHVGIGFVIMYVAGLLSGLLGIGSGVFKVLAMDTAMHLPMRVSVTTSEYMIGVTAAASAGIFFLRGDMDPVIAAPIALGILLGASVGVRVLPKLSNTSLRHLFLVIVLLAAVSMLARGFGWF